MGSRTGTVNGGLWVPFSLRPSKAGADADADGPACAAAGPAMRKTYNYGTFQITYMT